MHDSINACICVCVHVYLLIMSFMFYACSALQWCCSLHEGCMKVECFSDTFVYNVAKLTFDKDSLIMC